MSSRLLLLYCLLIISFHLIAQTNNYKSKIDSLESLKDQYVKKIKQIDSELNVLHQKEIAETPKDTSKISLDVILNGDAIFSTEASISGRSKTIPSGSKITLLEYASHNWKIRYKQELGYINDVYVYDIPGATKLKEAFESNKGLTEITKIKKEQLESDKRKLIEEEKENKRFESIKASGSPIYFLTAKVTFNSIGNPEASISLKNISDKTIDAYDVNIYCYNRYGNAVNHYAYNTNRFGGTSQETVKPDETDYSTWTLYGHENTAKIKVVLEKVHFTNGKTWYPTKGKSISIEGVSNN